MQPESITERFVVCGDDDRKWVLVVEHRGGGRNYMSICEGHHDGSESVSFSGPANLRALRELSNLLQMQLRRFEGSVPRESG